MVATFTPKQIYKTRAEAFRLFIQAQDLPVKQSKFFQDADRLNMVKPDKSIDLSSLLAYVREELRCDPSTGQSLVDRDLTKRKEELDIKERELKIEKLQREGRKDDRDWIHRETVFEREGALVGSLLAEARYQNSRAVNEIITLCNGDPTRAREIKACLDRTLYQAFQSLYDAGEVDIAFEVDEEL